MSKKDPETAIVTGAARCTLAAVAERPAGDGFSLVINCAGEHGSAAALVARIQQVGWGAMVHQADVNDAEAVRGTPDAALDDFVGVGVLVNADIMRVATFAEADDASLDRHVAINRKGVIIGLREASKRIVLEDLLSPQMN
jgi:3-oxoacyl-[acyl-carrier protein] reductase